MEVPLTVEIFFFKGTICCTLKRLELLDGLVAVACVYVCMCARALSRMVATFLQAFYLQDWLCCLAAAFSRSLSLPTSPVDCRLRALLSRSLSLPTPPADCRLLALLRRLRTLFCSSWRWVSARALSLARPAASSLWCCCSWVHSARDAAVARKWLALGLRARST